MLRALRAARRPAAQRRACSARWRRSSTYDVPQLVRVLHVNLTAAFALTQVLLPLLRASPDAVGDLHLAAASAAAAAPYWGAYAVSKFARRGTERRCWPTNSTGNPRCASTPSNPGRRAPACAARPIRPKNAERCRRRRRCRRRTSGCWGRRAAASRAGAWTASRCRRRAAAARLSSSAVSSRQRPRGRRARAPACRGGCAARG